MWSLSPTLSNSLHHSIAPPLLRSFPFCSVCTPYPFPTLQETILLKGTLVTVPNTGVSSKKGYEETQRNAIRCRYEGSKATGWEGGEYPKNEIITFIILDSFPFFSFLLLLLFPLTHLPPHLFLFSSLPYLSFRRF